MGFFSFGGQCLPLSYSETVLLVRYHQCQGRIFHLFLDQGMSSNDQISFSGSNFRISLPLLLRRHRACQKHRTKSNAIFFYIARNGLKMLYSQYLRRGHHCSLITISRTHEKCQHCQDRLTGAYISLNQAVHGIRTSHILPELPPDLFLGFCQRKRQLLQKSYGIRGLIHGKMILRLRRQIFIFPKNQ